MVSYLDAAKYACNLLIKKWNSMKTFEGQNDSFWVAGNTYQTFLDYWTTTGSPPNTNVMQLSMAFFHKTVPTNAPTAQLNALAQGGLDGKSGAPWLDDYGWWANAFLTALENATTLGLSSGDIATLLQDAKNCWYLMHYGWDPTASPLPGGVWNCKRLDWKLTGRNSVTNLQFWLMCVRLAAYTKDSKYLDSGANALEWFENGFKGGMLFDANSRLVRERMRGFEHADETDGFYWAGDQGVFVGCLLADDRATPLSTLRDEVANFVLANMLDNEGVLHDHVISDPGLADFDNDYACGKGVFMRHAVNLARRTKNPLLVKCILTSADYAYNTAPVNPNFERSIQFDWNPDGKLPPGDWDDTTRTKLDPYRGMILQAGGVNVFTAAAAIAPSGAIPT